MLRFVFSTAAVLTMCVSAFFTFYTVRLFYVTRFFTVGGLNRGAYIGGVAFPVLAMVLWFCARWSWRKARSW